MRIGGDFRRTSLLTNNAEVSTGRFYFNGAQTRDRSRGTFATTACPGGTNVAGCTNGDAMADFLLGYLSYYEAATPIRKSTSISAPGPDTSTTPGTSTGR